MYVFGVTVVLYFSKTGLIVRVCKSVSVKNADDQFG